MNKNKKVVIVGGGHAGGSLVSSLRQAGFDGSITLVSDENSLPYHRPPLSKSWLKETVTIDKLYLRPPSFYEEKLITLMLDSKAEKIDRSAKKLFLADGAVIEYDVLVLATGARARRINLPDGEFNNVHYLRNIADADKLKSQLGNAKSLAVIGGGYIGLETAASARELGINVSVVEQESRLLARVASETLSHYYQGYHQANGIEILLGERVVEFKGRENRLESIVLESKKEITFDIALVGIGAVPNDDLAREASLSIDNGIIVDSQARTSDPSIFAIGDVSRRPLPVFNCHFRLENISNTLEQAKIVASVIIGQPIPAAEVPWFWSDQYDIKLQIAGLSINTDQDILRGDPESDKFSVFRFCEGRLMAVEAVNNPIDFMVGKKWIGSATELDIHLLGDTSVNIKNCVL